uniref:Uncharacterized protein n=1 Tax=Arundo donax TaxID=35708 RepID=A0A0A8XR87_ARUDO
MRYCCCFSHHITCLMTNLDLNTPFPFNCLVDYHHLAVRSFRRWPVV